MGNKLTRNLRPRWNPFLNYLCDILAHLYFFKIITDKKREIISSFLKKEIIKEQYSKYPVIYCECEFGEQTSIFFFEMDNWSIRIKWLKELLTNIKD